MALIKCPECGREKVSDTAEACPGCGYGVKAHFERIRKEEEKDKKREADVELAKKISGLARKPKLYSHDD